MQFLYNFSIFLFGIVVQLASIFNSKAKKWSDGRKEWKNTLPKIDGNRDIIWFHCASLGEFDQGLPVMKEWKRQNPEDCILVTFFSPSAMLHYHKRNHCADYVLYLPLDTPSNALFFIDHFLPKAIFFVKYEFWANYISYAHKRKIPVYSIATIFRKNQHFFKWYGAFFRGVLKKISYFYVQNEESFQLLHSIGVNECQVVGDTRFDSVLETKNLFLNQINEGHLDEDWIKFETFLEGKKAIIIGSSWPAEERLIIPYILENKQLKFILAPHDISNQHITKIEQGLGDSCVRFTHFNEINNSVNCLILDTIGHLSKAYYFGEIALVGGGFSGKLHNILEPAVFGLPVLFGPNHTKFPEANLFLKNQIAFEFKDENEMENKLNLLIQEDPILSSEIKNFIASQSGAALKIISSLRIGS